MPHLNISVVIPLYNEADNLTELQNELRAALAGIEHEIIFVDDCSTDATVDTIEGRSEVRLLRLERRSGQSAAMYFGIYAATKDIIVLLDGDRQNDPADIRHLLTEIEGGADLVCGYRLRRQDTLIKRLTSRIANWVRSRFVNDRVRDSGCTLKAMRRECRDALVPFNGMHRFIPALIKGAGFKVVEIPVNHRPRTAGKSKYSLQNRAISASVDMLGVRWLVSRRFALGLTTVLNDTSTVSRRVGKSRSQNKNPPTSEHDGQP